ncbi:MAG: ArsR/SmtB family transcription factor [Planctomycetaceae bacterium]
MISMPGLDAATSLLRLLGDPSRVRLLSLLARQEMSVAALTAATRLAQSRVSSHLGRLREAGIVEDRKEGAACFYRLREPGMPGEARELWTLLRAAAKDPLLEEDAARARALDRAPAAASPLERPYSPGRTWEALQRGLLGLVRLGDVLDIACGDGAVSALLAPHAASVVGLDRDETLLRRAAARCAPNLSFRRGDMHALPFPEGSFDEALLLNCLTCTEKPGRALAEAARVLRPGGRAVAVTLAEHAHRSEAARFGHIRRGFRPAALRAAAVRAGLRVTACAVTSREPRPPHFEIVTLHAHRPEEANR